MRLTKNTSNTLQVVSEIVKDGLQRFGRSIAIYHPQLNNNDAGERNLSIHFASAFLEHGYAVFAEVNPNMKPKNRLDGLVISSAKSKSDGRHFACLETKRFYSLEGGEGLIRDDTKRIRDFELIVNRVNGKTPKMKVGIIVAITNKVYADWWMSDLENPPKGSTTKKGNDWIKLKRNLVGLDHNIRGRVEVTFKKYNDERHNYNSLVYCVYIVPPPKKKKRS